MSKVESKLAEVSAELDVVKRTVADLLALPVIVQARQALHDEQIRISSADREREAKAKAEAEKLVRTRVLVTEDPLVRSTVYGGPGASFSCRLSYPTEKRLDREPKFSLAGEGSSAIGGNWFPQACTRRRSDWLAIVNASGGQLEHAIKTGHILVHEYTTDEVLGDTRLVDAWWKSTPRP